MTQKITGVQWTCPICGASRTGMATDDRHVDSDIARAKTALLSHVNASADEEHGGKNRIPDELDQNRLDRYIESAD